MSRAYSTSTVAHILGVTHKWLDNLLSSHPIATADARKQGRARRLSSTNVAQLYVAKALIESLGCPARTALRAAQEILSANEIKICPGFRMILDPDTIEQTLNQVLVDAVEATPPRTRGRPPNRVDPEPDYVV